MRNLTEQEIVSLREFILALNFFELDRSNGRFVETTIGECLNLGIGMENNGMHAFTELKRDYSERLVRGYLHSHHKREVFRYGVAISVTSEDDAIAFSEFGPVLRYDFMCDGDMAGFAIFVEE